MFDLRPAVAPDPLALVFLGERKKLGTPSVGGVFLTVPEFPSAPGRENRLAALKPAAPAPAEPSAGKSSATEA